MKETANFHAPTAAKKLLRKGRSAALATLEAGSGAPYCSLVNIATAVDGAPLLLLSRLALHTKNILADPRVSLMIDERKDGDPLQGARIMLMGQASVTDAQDVRRRYLARQPEAKIFVDFPDFHFYRIAITGVHLVAGFGRIVDLRADEILTDVSQAASLIAAEEEIIAHMNSDHADTMQLYASKLLNAPEGPWRCVGCDPDGLDMQSGRLALRLDFPHRADTPGALRSALKALAAQARA